MRAVLDPGSSGVGGGGTTAVVCTAPDVSWTSEYNQSKVLFTCSRVLSDRRSDIARYLSVVSRLSLTQPLLQRARGHTALVVARGEGPPKLVQRPVLADRVRLAGQPLLVDAISAVQSSPKRDHLQLAEKMSIRLTARRGENPLTRAASLPLHQLRHQAGRYGHGAGFAILNFEIVPISFSAVDRTTLLIDVNAFFSYGRSRCHP